jgi:hypothetical protein
MKITQEQFDDALASILDESPASHLLSVPGVYEAVSEHFNNDVLARVAEEAEYAAGDSDACFCEDCGEHIQLVERSGETPKFQAAERRAAFVRGFKSWVAFDSCPEDPVEAVGFKAAAALNEHRGGERPEDADAVDECIHFFDREED